MYESFLRKSAFGLVAMFSVAAALPPVTTLAEEVTVQNDSLQGGDLGNIQLGFIGGESAAAWLTSPCDGDIVAVQVFWRSLLGLEPPTLEDSITIFGAGAFPTPGAELALLEGPVMTDSMINEFRYLDENQTIPLIVPTTEGQTFVVSFKFYNTPPPLGPSVVTDVDGCQAGKNAIYAIPGGWLNSCLLGLSGDFVIRAVVECDPTQACCFKPSGCLDLSAADCAVAGGFSQGVGTQCATTVCFPAGACCDPDGFCTDDVAADDCTAGGGTYQGDGSLCSEVTCPQPDGACCLSSGNCLELTEEECNVVPGAFWAGPLTDCTDADTNGTADACEEGPQACCVLDVAVVCLEETSANCVAADGIPQGPGTACLGPEACCLADGSCAIIDRICCDDAGGTPQGSGTTCGGVGACCLDIDGGPLSFDTCAEMDEICCVNGGGLFHGTGTTCTTEACCLPSGFCQDADPACCTDSGGVARGPGSMCLGACPSNTA